jgi:hypothetical protein
LVMTFEWGQYGHIIATIRCTGYDVHEMHCVTTNAAGMFDGAKTK